MKPMRGKLRNLTYSELVAFLVSFCLLDMLSTDIVLYHGSGKATEINDLVGSMHNSGSIIIFRVLSLVLIATLLYLARLHPVRFERAKLLSWKDVALGKANGLSRIDVIKINAVVVLSLLCVTRLFVALSNICGELLGISVPILVSDTLGWTSHRAIGLVSILVLSVPSIIMVSAIWEVVRRSPGDPAAQLTV